MNSEPRRMLLEVEDMSLAYGNIQAVHGISLSIPEGSLVALVGANGAGKSSTLNAISGLLPISQGAIRFEGQSITRLKAHEITRRGIVQVPEGRRIFGRLSVEENLLMGAFSRKDHKAIAEDRDRMFELFPRLKERRRQVAGTLSGGEQQMVATARGLMARPRVLLMDEPSMGLAPLVVEQVFETIKSINAAGTTVLLVEQNALMALEIAHHAYVMEHGEIVLEGAGPTLARDERVIAIYLG
jgi:branched-chain amino acid transport system ATP-binding protein